MVQLVFPSSSHTWIASAALLATAAIACGAESGDDIFQSSPGAGGSKGGSDVTVGGSGGGGDNNPGGGGGDSGGNGGGGEVPAGVVTLSGQVSAPSGAFPIAGALVYLTKAAPEAIPTGVFHYECDEMSDTPYTFSRPDGSWTIPNVSVGNWNLVTRKGNFRRVRPITVTNDMNPALPWDLTTLPRKRTPDGLDVVPSFAVVKTEPDVVYNLLAKFGMGDVNGQGNLIQGSEEFDVFDESSFSSYPHTRRLFDDNLLHNYHMVFLPCNSASVGVQFVNNNVQKIRDYVSAGGRIYNSCTVSLWTKAPFPEYINYSGNNSPVKWDIGRSSNTAYGTQGLVANAGLADWLNVLAINPNSVPFKNGYVTINSTVDVPDGHGLEKDEGVVKPYTWVTNAGSDVGKPLMVTYNYDLGKVFYSVYETSTNSAVITPQEFVLLYVILEVGVCENLPPVIY